MAPNPKPASTVTTPVSHTPAAAHLPPTPPTHFPTAACGPHIAPAIIAAAARTQAPPELIAHHLLTLAAMAAQRLIAVRLPTGAVRPVSTYFLTIAGSGEGRSAAENMCVGPVRFWQQRFAAAASMYRDEKGRRLERHHINIHLSEEGSDEADDDVTEIVYLAPVKGPDPAQPSKPFECDEVFLSLHRAGVNDRYDRYARFGRRSGLFAAVPADLLTPSIARRNEAGSLSNIWDGGVVVPGDEGAALAPRLSVHLVAGAGEALALLRAPEAADSGLLGRLLAVAPASRIGTRVFSESDGTPPPELHALHARLTDLYAQPAPFEARVIAMDEAARADWFTFAQQIEAAMIEGGPFAPIRALAGRLAEHAARLAAVIALTEDAGLTEITPPMLARGIALARFYADEALRLFSLPSPSEADPLSALQAWLERKYAGQQISLREVYCFGPPPLRSATLALRAMRQLEVLGVTEPVKQEGTKRGGHWFVAGGRDPAALQPPAA